ncbi:MAG: peptidoglycan editing factor PgeF [Gammaproteobacteria bacterium]|nr:peptidoglycan editing factor PgeF [Gammaproteobacteria bacterium]MYF30396.1 peptidoglycan editing factor PgeF [Gammaproteobacteria bacterium]MYK46772.1 peptidoglycan editing factor PgeF [Gammaproteobacteria bacterium]
MLAARVGSTLIEPEWPVPNRVRALVTTRAGGVSEPPYESFNLAFHVGDAAERVKRNRRRLLDQAGIEVVQWLDQEHGQRVLAASSGTAAGGPITADASWTMAGDLGLAVLVADCVPLLLADEDASLVAVAHCGWRGTVAGVVEATLDALPSAPGQLIAWLGPGVCRDCYEVGPEVRDALDGDERAVLDEQRRRSGSERKWLMDLPALIVARLRRSGVGRIVASSLCTICDKRFYSYRRDGRTGRFAALIWLAARGV